VCFDDAENVLNEDGSLRPFLSDVLIYLHESVEFDVPVFLLSTQRPRLGYDARLESASHVMAIRRLRDEDLLYCLQNWLDLADPGGAPQNSELLAEAARQLHGYPIAARLAAYLVAQYSVETLLAELSSFTDIRVGIATQLLGRLRATLSSNEVNCLQALAVADAGLTLFELSTALKISIADAREAIDRLVDALFVEYENGALQIHPMIRDYYWRRLYESGEWRALASALGEVARSGIEGLDPTSPEFVSRCAKAYRLFALAGRLEDARGLVLSFDDQLREVARRLYRARETPRALEYLQLWLKVEPDDLASRWYLARCFTRLQRFDDAEHEIEILRRERYRIYQTEHALGLLRRDQRRFDEAIFHFEQGLSDRPEYVPLLRDLGDVLGRSGERDRALKVLARAYELAPRDSYVVPKYVDLLADTGRIEEALDIMEGAFLAFPEQGAFAHRMATLLIQVGRGADALAYARDAVARSGSTLPEATLTLANLEVRFGDTSRAEALLQTLPTNLPRQTRLVRDTVLAGVCLARGDVAAAREAIVGWDPLEDGYIAHLVIRIGLSEIGVALSNGKRRVALAGLERTQQVLDAAMARYPNHSVLLEDVGRVEEVARELG